MSATSIDNSWDHLFPAFRAKLEAVLHEAEAATGHKWVIAEGLRTQERQTWLYAQGRTRPGKVVTWLKTPLHHGAGLAADCYPSSNGKTPDYSLPHSYYEKYRTIYQKHGLENPAWGQGDYGHVQWPATDAATHEKAADWVAAGFPQIKPISVFVAGRLVPDALAYQDRAGATWVQLRPVIDQIPGWSIKIAAEPRATLQKGAARVLVPFTIDDQGRGFSPVKPLCEALGMAKGWDPAKREVRIS